jgi:uncharacterized membrane protein
VIDLKAPRRRFLFRIPALALMLRDLEARGTESLAWLLVAIVGGAAALTLAFGLPGLVLGMLGVTALMIVVLIYLAKP